MKGLRKVSTLRPGKEIELGLLQTSLGDDFLREVHELQGGKVQDVTARWLDRII